MSDRRRGREAAAHGIGAPTLQLLAWVAERPRTYADVMEAWRSSCPRLSIWEDATTDGLVRLEGGRCVVLTPRGRAILEGEALPEPAKASHVVAAEE
jgi:hypothetical protein